MDLSSRVTTLNDSKPNSKSRYVLYWMQMFNRAEVQRAALHGII
jgi:hypothetical protein